MKRRAISLSVVLVAIVVCSLGQSAAASAPPSIVIGADGETAPVFSYADAIRERVLIPVAGVDQDNDGVTDQVAADIIRPLETTTGLKVPAIIDASPYFTSLGRSTPSEYLNIYADRGNIAVLSSRARWRGIGLEVEGVSLGDELRPGEHDLLYIGGGQDREQGLIAPDLARRADAIREAVGGGAAVLAVCGGYQLLGRFYRGRDGAELPGAGLFPLDTVAGDRRMIGDCLLECELDPGVRRTLAGFENHAGVTRLDEGVEPLGRVVAGFGNDGASGLEGVRVGNAIGTYLHGPLLPRNAWLADWILERALEHRTGERRELDPLPDELEDSAQLVAAERARSRGGRY